MENQSIMQRFEAYIQGYNGDDPLNIWDRCVLWAEETLPPQEKRNILSLLERLIRNFIGDKKYCNDERYIKHCIRFAETVDEPIQFFDYLYNQGIGSRSAALYVVWAQQLEAKGDVHNARVLYQKAFENSAHPKDLLDHNYRAFQLRICQKNPPDRGALSVQPLRDSQIINQMAPASDADSLSHGKCQNATGIQNPIVKAPEVPVCTQEPSMNNLVTISKSAVVRQPSASSCSGMKQVPMYCKDKLVSGDSEISLEEFRANIYKQKYEQRRKTQQWEEEEKKSRKVKEEAVLHELKLKQKMEQLSSLLNVQGTTCQTAPEQKIQEGPTEANMFSSLGLNTHGLPVQGAPYMDRSHMSTSVPCELSAPSVLQPSSSLEIDLSTGQSKPALTEHQLTPLAVPGLDQQAHSIVAPGPDTDSHHIQPTLPIASADDVFTKPLSVLEKSASSLPDAPNPLALNSSGHVVKLQPGMKEVTVAGNSSGYLANTSHVTPNTSMGFMQATPSKVLPSPTVNTREALGFIMDIFQTSTLPEEEDDNLLETTDPNNIDIEAFCRNDNNTNAGGFFSLQNAAPAVSSAFCIFEDDANKVNGPSRVMPLEVNTFGDRPALRSTLKSAAQGTESAVEDCTIWAGRCNKTLAPSPNSTRDFALAARLASTPANSKQPDQTWEILEDKENVVNTDQDNGCPMDFDFSEAKIMQASKIRKLSPIQEQSPEHSKIAVSVPLAASYSMFPAQCPEASLQADEVECAGKRLEACKLSDTLHCSVPNLENSWDVEEEEPELTVQKTEQVIINNAWDDQLIAELLSRLPTPLGSLSCYYQWRANIPCLKAKVETKLGSQLIHVDYLLGEGAFARVYQACIMDTTLHNNVQVILKVQKPAKPWEFYIGTQIIQRMNPELRHLYISFHSAHIFQNGSILVGDLYCFGSLLNVINIYKKLIEKVMPVQLVMYFTINLLYIVEQLHNIGIIHGDIKPDNFALGEKVLDYAKFNLDLVSHGLALIDFGQSIDMTLFQQGTAFTAKCETSGFQCVEMLTNKPWNYQTDYFGVAGTVYCMLFGTYMKVREEYGAWRAEGNFKRLRNGDFWVDFFHTLLNIPDCHSPSPLGDLREKLTSLFTTLYINKTEPLLKRLCSLLVENKPSRK